MIQPEEQIVAMRMMAKNGSDEEIRHALETAISLLEKNTHRLEKITKQSDAQQRRVLQLNDDLELAYKELNEYKQNLEIKVEEETNKRVTQEKILLQNAKMAEMGNMLGAIIHQWKQPITIISLLSDLMSRDLQDGDWDMQTMSENMKTIKERVLFLSHTIDDFRNFFKPDKEPTLFYPKAIIEEVLKIIEHQILKYNAIVRVEGDDNISLCGFPNEIKHVILNLVNNALEAAGDHTKKINDIPRITIVISQTRENTRIDIQDNGGGIAANIMKNLFAPYNSSKGDAGTGIGLTLAKTIIEEHHGGTIRAVNTDIGADFMLCIPTIKAD